MISESSQFNIQESAKSKNEHLEKDLTSFINRQNYSVSDIEQAFLIANGDDSVEDKNIIKLAEKMKGLLDDGMPLNKIGQIIADVKEGEVNKKNYIEKLSLFKFDNKSIKILQQLPNMESSGTCIIKVNGQILYNFEISSESGAQNIMDGVIDALDDLGDAGRQFSLQADFFELR